MAIILPAQATVIATSLFHKLFAFAAIPMWYTFWRQAATDPAAFCDLLGAIGPHVYVMPAVWFAVANVLLVVFVIHLWHDMHTTMDENTSFTMLGDTVCNVLIGLFAGIVAGIYMGHPVVSACMPDEMTRVLKIGGMCASLCFAVVAIDGFVFYCLVRGLLRASKQ